MGAWKYNPLVTIALIGSGLILLIRLASGKQCVIRTDRRGWMLLTIVGMAALGINWAYVLWRLTAG